MAKGNPHMDIGFTSILQCNNVCKEMKERYGAAPLLLEIRFARTTQR